MQIWQAMWTVHKNQQVTKCVCVREWLDQMTPIVPFGQISIVWSNI